MKPACQQKNARGEVTSRRPPCWLSAYSMPVDIQPTGTSRAFVCLILPVEAAISLSVPPVVCSPLQYLEIFRTTYVLRLYSTTYGALIPTQSPVSSRKCSCRQLLTP